MSVNELCLTLCNTMDCSASDFSVHGICQARILEWIAIPFSRASFQPRIEPGSSALQEDSLPSEPQGKLMGTFLRELLIETSNLLSDPG